VFQSSILAQPSPRRSFVGLLVIVLAAVGMELAYRSWKSSEQTANSSLPRFGVVPEFSLIDHEGRPFGSKDLHGKVWIADFIATRSSGPDPILSSRFAELDTNFKKSEQLRLISFTVDPQNDTPGVLRDYARRFEASPRWYFLTGDKQKVDELAGNGFQLAARDPNNVSSEEVRTTKFVLVDADGAIRGYYDGTSNEVIQRLLTDLGSLLRVGGR
jgi:protein SCO1